MFLKPRNRNSMQASGRATAPGLKQSGIASEEGAALVEFAIACAIFFALLFGVFELSLGFYTFHYVSNAARQGSRWAMVRGSACAIYTNTTPCPAQESDIANYVKGLAYPGIDSVNNMTVKVYTYSYDISNSTWTSCGEMSGGTICNAPGDQVQVQVTYAFPLSIPFWATPTFTNCKAGSVCINSTSTQVISQ